MENSGNFTSELLAALDEKTKWYDSDELPRLLESYRLLHTCVRNIFDLLVKKSLITPDPYKFDKKISDITAPEGTQFIEGEKSTIMGQRFSDYDTTLDYICNYYKFSVENLSLTSLKKLADFNSSILWTNFSSNSNKANTRVLAGMINNARQSSDALTVSMINDSLSKANNAMTEINSILKEYADFRREVYKGLVRRKVIGGKGFDLSAAFSSPESEIKEIKKNFAANMGKQPVYKELIEEIAREDQGPNKEEAQRKVLDKMHITVHVEKSSEAKVDTKAMLMEAIEVLGGLPGTLGGILEKIKANHEVIERSNDTVFNKIRKLFRKAFNLEEPPIYYPIIIVEPGTGAKRQEKLNYNQFVSDIAIKAKRYTILSQKKSSGYQKILAMEESKLFEFIAAQISDCNKMLLNMTVLDEFFKTAASPGDKSKIKGLKIHLTTMKNTIVKANQKRSEYASYVEEVAQMKKLGIQV